MPLHSVHTNYTMLTHAPLKLPFRSGRDGGRREIGTSYVEGEGGMAMCTTCTGLPAGGGGGGQGVVGT